MRVKLLVSVLIGVSADLFAQNPFPYVMPKEKPTFKMSCAMNRVYDNYGAATPQLNELYTNFKYSPLTGFDYEETLQELLR